MRNTKLLLVAAAALGVAGLATAMPDNSSTVLRDKQGDHLFQVIVVPGQPSVGRLAMIQLDLNEVPAIPDPTYGDRVPVQDASLVAVVSPDRAGGETLRFSMHPVGGAGRYGFHWTPEAKGLYRLAFERRDGKLPEASFKLGVDVETPAQDIEAKGQGLLGRRTLTADRPRLQRATATVAGPLTPVGAGPSAPKIMAAIEEPAALLTETLAQDAPDLEAVKAHLAALTTETAKLRGTVPDDYKAGEADYDRLADALEAQLGKLTAEAQAGKLPAVQKSWRETLDGTCTQCHVKFWWAVTPDLDEWPKVTASPWKR